MQTMKPAHAHHGAPRAHSALSVLDARARIAEEVDAVEEVESVGLRDTLGRVLARDILAPFHVPPHTNSAMDGYAIAGADLGADPGADSFRAFRVVGTAWAGRPYGGVALQPGQAIRIMTGAVMPRGADTVLMQEHVAPEGDTVRLRPEHAARYRQDGHIYDEKGKGRNVRAAGEDLAKGALVLRAGRRIAPADLGLLASLGISSVAVKRRLRVAFFCTGDELRSLGEPLEEGAIYDSNRHLLYAMLARLGVEMDDLGIVADQPEAIRAALTQAAGSADMVLVTGGVSVGEADHVKTIFDELGQMIFQGVAMKPGHPLTFGRIGTSLFFGLPGNPVAVMVCFYQFVQLALARMAGEIEPAPAPTPAPTPVPTQRVTCLSRLSKKPGRTEFVRGVLTRDAAGWPAARKTGSQGSGILRSMSLADCFIVLPEAAGDMEPGDTVEVQAFWGLM